jgi:hypothetical protein
MVAPRQQGSLYVLELDDVVLEIDAAIGGRVTALRLEGRNLLTGPEADAGNFGSTFWTSPQTQWGWPPVTEIDTAAYAAAIEDGAIVMRGATSVRLGVAVEKRFSADAARRVLSLEYRILNRAPEPFTTAPWEITRVHPGGLTFFPSGGGVYPPTNLAVRQMGAITWFAYDAAAITDHQKLFADAAAGRDSKTWIAHVDGDALLLKTFDLVPRAAHAPGEAQIEIYAAPAHTYVEVEQQGAFQPIAPGAALVWRVDWIVRRLPAEVARTAGSAALVDFVRALVAG